ncbi:MAG: site-specific DNA-methyltransferase [Nitrospirae bacterium]|nr:site-specific DNA-methyltransferase [Nitrospirota bacterium]
MTTIGTEFAMNKINNPTELLKELLKTLFQFESTELDFGIYRIMNYKRKEIEDFVDKDLIQVIEKEFERYRTQSSKELLEKIEEKKKEIERLEKELGEKILKNGEIEEKFKDKPFAKEYLELKRQLNETEITDSTQTQVFNDLYNFFLRYYEDGDFISKRRISSKHHRYAIPYDGEEVKLYWANFDQYYVKTGEVFKDYEFTHKGWRTIFKTIFANVETGNVKGERRYFVLAEDKPLKVDSTSKICLIQFEYKPLTDAVLKQYKIKTKSGEEKKTGISQDDINVLLRDKILQNIKELELKAILTEEQNEKTILEKHIYKYTRKITSDFFIHKNLKGFLERELDYFIKSEVIDLNNLEPRHITRAKVVEGIGKWIIEFLAQIEDFQKMLWEKKKFVLKTDYVITIDRLPEEFHKEILANKKQLKEWEALSFGKISKYDDLIARNDLTGREFKKLPVDTKHFSEDFKERLLEYLSEHASVIARNETTKQALVGLDDLIDGVLIKSENWQALNFLKNKYKGKIQSIYIDPPFNTGTNEFLYKNNYLDSSWVTTIYDRLDLGKTFLKDDGSIFVRIDYHGNHYVRFLMNEVFCKENFGNEIIVNRFKRQLKELTKLNVATESLIYYVKTQNTLINNIFRKRTCTFCGREIEAQWRPMSSPELRYPPERTIQGKTLLPPKGRHWTFTQEKIDLMQKEGRIRINTDLNYIDLEGNKIKGLPEYLQTEETPVDSNWTDLKGYAFGSTFATENAEELIDRVLKVSTNTKNWVLDFFLGSGTTTAVSQKIGRKWIGIEIGNYFENIPLKRMKMVLSGDRSGISKTVNWKGGGFFKYHYLEQYEDTLHNIEFPQEEKGQKALELFGKTDESNEYLMKYFLRYETEGSPSLLTLKQFENPFEYKLKIISGNKGEEIVNVDLIETFNYLIGLKVNKYKFMKDNSSNPPSPPFSKGRKGGFGNGRKYVFIFGEKGNRRIAIVWRSTKDINLEKDREVIENVIGDYNPDEVFINGDAFYPKGYMVIETEFKALMGV